MGRTSSAEQLEQILTHAYARPSDLGTVHTIRTADISLDFHIAKNGFASLHPGFRKLDRLSVRPSSLPFY